MNPRYDFDKENDKEFLREAGKMLQEKVISLEIKLAQAILLKILDEEIKGKLTGELLVLRRRFFDARQEKKEKLKKLKKDKKKKKINLLHNQNENKNDKNILDKKKINLTSEEIEHSIENNQCPRCQHDHLVEIPKFFDESPEIDINTSTTYYVLKRHKRKKYKCNHCQQLVTASGPPKLIDRGAFSIQMGIEIVDDKFGYHIPLERQRVKMLNAGLNVSVKTLYSQTEHIYQLLFELNEMNRLKIIDNHYVNIDESPIPYFTDKKQSGYAWSISNQKGVYYQFEASRAGKVAKEMLKGFQGAVVTDAIGTYDFLSTIIGIIHCYCWAHLRRYFFDAMAESDRIGIIVDYIDELYEIEHMALNYADLKYLRETRSKLIVNKIKSWIDENEHTFLNSNLCGKAIRYFYNQFKGLTHFLTNEYIPIDNNGAERCQRAPVMGRNNYNVFRSINGADVAMFFYSLIESCKKNGINQKTYLYDMCLRKLKGLSLEVPFDYAMNLRKKIQNDLNNDITKINNTQ